MKILRQQKIKRYIQLFFLLILLSLFWWYDIFELRTFNGNYNDVIMRINNQSVYLDIADTSRKQRIGFSKRNMPNLDQGILFKYDFVRVIENSGIWMKNMRFGIDIMWFNKDFELIDFVTDIYPETYPKVFYPKIGAQYILEMPAGFVNRSQLEIGHILEYL